MRVSQLFDQLMVNADLNGVEFLNSCVGSSSVEEYYHDGNGNLYQVQVKKISADEYPFEFSEDIYID